MLTKLLLIASMATVTDAFAFDLFNAFAADPVLAEFNDVKTVEQFKVQLDIGQDEKSPHMFLDGLCLEMVHEKAKKSDVVGLPGADGPHPKSSTGAHQLNVLSHPAFIDIFGTQKVRFERAAWEMIWKKGHYSGSFVCGFDVPVGAKRNDANMPAGRIYLSFPVWNQEGLVIRQAEKFETDIKVKELVLEKDAELEKYQTSTNLFQKAMHYRNAIAAVEKIDLTGHRFLSTIPMDDDIIPIGDGLLLNVKGHVWLKEAQFFGSKHTPLGTAVMSAMEEVSQENTLRP